MAWKEWGREMAKVKELREKTTEQLEFELGDRKTALFKLRCRGSSEKTDNASMAKDLRRDIARLLTILKTRQDGAKA